MNKIILCDFDGTITKQDTLVKILDRFAGPDWRLIEKKINKEEFGNRLGLKQEFSLCDPKKATKAQISRLLKDEIDIDPYFKQFLEFCGREGFEFVIVSGGFSFCIDTILKKHNLSNIKYYSNNLVFGETKFTIENPYCADDCQLCGNCKTMHLRRYRAGDYYIIYIGDSTTDRCPVKYADLAFTKAHLTEYCVSEKIDHVPYETFADIQAYLSENMPAIMDEIEENICDACPPAGGEKKYE
jgi:2-hydroxy-3-keto-5-methylthiopentenyl-1-phosphate phosphatase